MILVRDDSGAGWEMEMIPSVIVEIAWHLPGGRYHSPSIITAHRRWGHPHQRLSVSCAKWPMDILLRRSASLSSHRDRPPIFSDVHCPTDLPGCLPPGGYRAPFGVSKQSVIRSVNKYRAGA